MLPRIAGRRQDDAAVEELNELTGTSEDQSQLQPQRFSYGAADEHEVASAQPGVESAYESDEEGEVAREEYQASADVAPSSDDEAIAVLTRRLRCLFSVITWPIVPLGTIVALALIWLLYAAFLADARQTCAHPLHWYAFVSLILVVYSPYHTRIRSYLFSYVRERDGAPRPLAVRRYDQLVRTLALLYVYGGITLVQTCREDMEVGSPDEVPENACAATCPNLFRALSVYVATVELFTLSLILPLFCLPCIYLYFLRTAPADNEALVALQERLREEEAIFRNGGVTAQEILQQFEPVRLVKQDERILVVVLDAEADESEPRDSNGVKECCICMADFVVHQGDVETAGGSSDLPDSEEEVVRSRSCGHIFHQRCIASWVEGRWQAPETNDSASDSPRRRPRARRTTCPLCRIDLRPVQTNSST